MAASFAVGVLLARGLGVKGYGYYGLALSVITIAGIPGEMGLPRLVTREVAAAPARDGDGHILGVISWANTIVLKVSVLVAVIAAAAAFALDQRGSRTLALAILCGAPVIPLMALARIQGGALQGLHHIVRGQIPANLLKPVLMSLLLLGIWLAGSSIGAPGAMAINAAASAAALLLGYVWLKQRLPKEQPAATIRGGARWLASSIPMALTDGMRILQLELTTLLLGLLAAPAEVGLLRIAIVTATVAATPIPVVNHVAFPVIARLYAKGDMEGLQKAVTRLARAQFAGVLLLSLPLLIAAEPLVGLVFGAEYEPAGAALRIISLAQIANAAFGPNVVLLNMTHQERRVTRSMAIALAFNIVAVPPLAAVAGLAGAAVALLFAFLIWNVLTWLDARRQLGIETSIFPVFEKAGPE